MDNSSERSEGAAEELGGKIKKGLGQLVGDDELELEGQAREIRGRTRQEAAKADERSKGKGEELKGAVKNRIGALIGNDRMQAEGKAKELQGVARQKANR
jgi:uncharacterized protein YjbJ (UPF0337 family)